MIKVKRIEILVKEDGKYDAKVYCRVNDNMSCTVENVVDNHSLSKATHQYVNKITRAVLREAPEAIKSL